jgi:hypothetical protein
MNGRESGASSEGDSGNTSPLHPIDFNGLEDFSRLRSELLSAAPNGAGQALISPADHTPATVAAAFDGGHMRPMSPSFLDGHVALFPDPNEFNLNLEKIEEITKQLFKDYGKLPFAEECSDPREKESYGREADRLSAYVHTSLKPLLGSFDDPHHKYFSTLLASTELVELGKIGPLSEYDRYLQDLNIKPGQLDYQYYFLLAEFHLKVKELLLKCAANELQVFFDELASISWHEIGVSRLQHISSIFIHTISTFSKIYNTLFISDLSDGNQLTEQELLPLVIDVVSQMYSRRVVKEYLLNLFPNAFMLRFLFAWHNEHGVLECALGKLELANAAIFRKEYFHLPPDQFQALLSSSRGGFSDVFPGVAPNPNSILGSSLVGLSVPQKIALLNLMFTPIIDKLQEESFDQLPEMTLLFRILKVEGRISCSGEDVSVFEHLTTSMPFTKRAFLELLFSIIQEDSSLTFRCVVSWVIHQIEQQTDMRSLNPVQVYADCIYDGVLREQLSLLACTDSEVFNTKLYPFLEGCDIKLHEGYIAPSETDLMRVFQCMIKNLVVTDARGCLDESHVSILLVNTMRHLRDVQQSIERIQKELTHCVPASLAYQQLYPQLEGEGAILKKLFLLISACVNTYSEKGLLQLRGAEAQIHLEPLYREILTLCQSTSRMTREHHSEVYAELAKMISKDGPLPVVVEMKRCLDQLTFPYGRKNLIKGLFKKIIGIKRQYEIDDGDNSFEHEAMSDAASMNGSLSGRSSMFSGANSVGSARASQVLSPRPTSVSPFLGENGSAGGGGKIAEHSSSEESRLSGGNYRDPSVSSSGTLQSATHGPSSRYGSLSLPFMGGLSRPQRVVTSVPTYRLP